MVSALFSIIANRNGKYYVSFVATDGDRDPNAKIAILGPFSQAEKAQQRVRSGRSWGTRRSRITSQCRFPT
jgi:hypothetical protein